MGQIRRQTIFSSLIIYAGFLLGAFNLLVVLPRLLPVEYIGLTRLLQDFAIIIISFAGLGFGGPFYRFSPYYYKYSKPGKNDNLQVFLMVIHVGILIVFAICFLFKSRIVGSFEAKSPLFSTYFTAALVFAYFLIIYNTLELYLFSKGESVIQSFTREIVVRVIILVLAISAFYFFTLDSFVWLFSAHYLLPVVILIWIIFRRYHPPMFMPFSNITRRLSRFMINMASWGMIQTIVIASVPVIDTLVIGGFVGLKGVAEYQIMSYVSTLVHVPVRATMSVIGARLAHLWMDNDLKSIQTVYERTSTNYLAFGLFATGIILANFDLIQKVTGKNISLDFSIIIILVFAKVFELSTGLSNVVIAYSKNWKYENIISMINIILAIPLNLIFVKKYGMMGVAVVTLILLILMFCIRFAVLYFTYGLIPFSTATLKLLLIFSILFGALMMVCNTVPTIWVKLLYTGTFAVMYLSAVLFFKISPDLNISYNAVKNKLIKLKSWI